MEATVTYHTKEKSIAERLKSLLPGQYDTFPIEKMMSVKTTASYINTMRGHKSISTRTIRDKKIIIAYRQ